MVEDEIKQQMLEAFLAENTTPLQPRQSIQAQREFLVRALGKLSPEDSLSLCRLIAVNGWRKLLLQCAEGVILNVDNLPDEIVERSYNLIMYKLNSWRENI